MRAAEERRSRARRCRNSAGRHFDQEFAGPRGLAVGSSAISELPIFGKEHRLIEMSGALPFF